MGLTPFSGMSAYLLGLEQLLLCSILLIIPAATAHCYTSEIKVPALYMPKHIELSLNVDKEIVSLQESIRQLDQEIVINPPPGTHISGCTMFGFKRPFRNDHHTQ